MRRRAVLAAAAAGFLPARGRAQKFADTLRVCWSDVVSRLDPYATPLRTGIALMPEIWDGLLYRDPDSFELGPLLATKWRRPDPLSIEFDLRTGVWFHDGSTFGAEDVLATVSRIQAGDLAIPSNYAWLAGADQVGETTVRLRLKHPFPAALEFITQVMPILPRDAKPDSGIGTGPWRVVDSDPQLLEFARNETYWAGSPKGRTRIARLQITQRNDPAAPFNALISGRADWIWQLTPEQYTALAQAPELQALRTDSMRVEYLALDAAGRSDPDGPLTKLEVRQAVCHAIDRTRLAQIGAPGGGRVINSPCYPTQFGCDSSAAVNYAFDRDKASSLLAAAGLPDGFSTRLVTYAKPDLADAVIADLDAVGIKTEPVMLPAAEAMARAQAGEAPLFLGSWGSSSINDMAAFVPPFFGGGLLDDARLPGLADLVARADAETDADRRRALYAQVIAQVSAGAAWLPLFINAATYGISRTLAFHPTLDELPRFYRMAWH